MKKRKKTMQKKHKNMKKRKKWKMKKKRKTEKWKKWNKKKKKTEKKGREPLTPIRNCAGYGREKSRVWWFLILFDGPPVGSDFGWSFF